MRRIAPILFWCLLGVVVVTTKCTAQKPQAPESPRQKSPQVSNFKDALLELHNKERQNKNLSPLALDERMCDYAQRHAETMAKKNNLYHSSMSKLADSCDGGSVAENIAWGQGSEKEVVSDWMWSPGHRWNILGKSHKRAGFGMAKSSNGTPYWCVVFSD